MGVRLLMSFVPFSGKYSQTQIASIFLNIRREYGKGLRRFPLRVKNDESATKSDLGNLNSLQSDYSKTEYVSERILYSPAATGNKRLIVGGEISNETDCSKETLNYKATPIIRKDDSRSGIAKYKALKENDKQFAKVLTLLKSRRRREKSNKVLIEGKRLITDAILAGLPLETLYFSKEEMLSDIPLHKTSSVEIMKVTYKQLQIWSDFNTSPGIIGVFKQLQYEELPWLPNRTLPVTVICDNVRDPGNMGSILRCAAAAGCQKVILTKGCVDIWEQKVLRSACGAHFRVPIINNISWELLNNYVSKDSSVYLADNQAFTRNLKSHGCSAVHVEDTNQSFIEVNAEGKSLKIDESYCNEEQLQQYSSAPLPCNVYSSIDFTKNETVLVIGGETEGLSNQSIKFAWDWAGSRIFVPIEHDVDCLNSAIAMAVIVFEIKRQHVISDE